MMVTVARSRRRRRRRSRGRRVRACLGDDDGVTLEEVKSRVG